MNGEERCEREKEGDQRVKNSRKGSLKRRIMGVKGEEECLEWEIMGTSSKEEEEEEEEEEWRKR